MGVIYSYFYPATPILEPLLPMPATQSPLSPSILMGLYDYTIPTIKKTLSPITEYPYSLLGGIVGDRT